jgi:8-oxo-dGTP pyrophosphatase MutT (NUDIX family)
MSGEPVDLFPELTDGNAELFPVSVKGILPIDGKIVLLKNERDEWELPGGKLEAEEAPIDCVVREIYEELGLRVCVDCILDAWVYDIRSKVKVLIVTYGCRLVVHAPISISHEHKAVGLFTPGEVEDLRMPGGYKRSICDYMIRFNLIGS